MSIFKPVAAGAKISLITSFLFHAQEGLPWDLLSIVDFEISGFRLHWSWPVFAIATVLAWVLQKAVQA